MWLYHLYEHFQDSTTQDTNFKGFKLMLNFLWNCFKMINSSAIKKHPTATKIMKHMNSKVGITANYLYGNKNLQIIFGVLVVSTSCGLKTNRELYPGSNTKTKKNWNVLSKCNLLRCLDLMKYMLTPQFSAFDQI